VNLPVDYDSLTAAERRAVRELYVKQQEGNCYYCKEFLGAPAPERITELSVDWTLFPPFFLKHPVHLQHNHDTGMTEGAVHAYCNAVMWQYEGR
jgi:hypothetical protein